MRKEQVPDLSLLNVQLGHKEELPILELVISILSNKLMDGKKLLIKSIKKEEK